MSREGRSLKFSRTALRFVSNDVAIVDGTLTFGIGGRRDGRVLQAGSEAITAVMKRTARVEIAPPKVHSKADNCHPARRLSRGRQHAKPLNLQCWRGSRPSLSPE